MSVNVRQIGPNKVLPQPEIKAAGATYPPPTAPHANLMGGT